MRFGERCPPKEGQTMETQNDSFVLGSEEESNHKRAVVVFYGPHYGGVREWGRIDKAIKIAKKHNCPLIICGDGCLGEGVTIFYDYAIGCGVEEVYAHFDSRQNTRGDAFGAVHVIVSRFPTLGRLHLVTDWYHFHGRSLHSQSSSTNTSSKIGCKSPQTLSGNASAKALSVCGVKFAGVSTTCEIVPSERMDCPTCWVSLVCNRGLTLNRAFGLFSWKLTMFFWNFWQIMQDFSLSLCL